MGSGTAAAGIASRDHSSPSDGTPGPSPGQCPLFSTNSRCEITTFLLSAWASQPLGPIDGGPSSTGNNRRRCDRFLPRREPDSRGPAPRPSVNDRVDFPARNQQGIEHAVPCFAMVRKPLEQNGGPLRAGRDVEIFGSFRALGVRDLRRPEDPPSQHRAWVRPRPAACQVDRPWVRRSRPFEPGRRRDRSA